METLVQFSNGLKSCDMSLENVANACRAFLMTRPVDCNSPKFHESILRRMTECDEIDACVFSCAITSSHSISFDTLFTWVRDIVPNKKRILDSVRVLCETYIKSNGEKGLVEVAKYLLDRTERDVDRLKSVSILCKILEAIRNCCESKRTETEEFVLTHSTMLLMLLSEAESKMDLQRVILIDLLPNLFTIRNGEDDTLRKRVANNFVRNILDTLDSKQKVADYRLRHEDLWSLSLSCEIVCGVLLVMSKCSSFDLKSCCSREELLKIVTNGLLTSPRSLSAKIVPAQEKRAVMLMRLVFETYVFFSLM